MASNVIKLNLCLIIYIYVIMVYFGVLDSIRGVTLPLMKNDLGFSYQLQGLLITISGIGYALFCIVATYVQDHYGPKISYFLGFLCIIAGSIVTYFSFNYIMIMCGLVISSFGSGFFEITQNYVSTMVFIGCSAVYMNMLHFYYGLGAVIGPWIATLFVNLLNQSYHGPYIIMLIPACILFAINFFMNYTVKRSIEQTTKEQTPSSSDDTHIPVSEETVQTSELPTITISQCLSSKYVWLLSITLGFMEVGEFGAMNWGGLYLQDLYGMDVTIEGATFVSMFYVLFTISRLVSGFWIDKMGLFNSLVFSIVATILILLAGFISGRASMYVLPFTGFFLAIMWPTLMCYSMLIFKNDTPKATSVIIVISGITNQIMQYLTGVINEYIGYVWGYRCNTVYMLLPMILLIICNHFYKKEILSQEKQNIEMKQIDSTKETNKEEESSEPAKKEEEQSSEPPHKEQQQTTLVSQ